jgi:transposase InsO family protein
VEASRIRPGESHENGVAERGHGVLKSMLEQALRLRGSRDFPTVEAYVAFVQHIVARDLNSGREIKLTEERAQLEPLPAIPLPE